MEEVGTSSITNYLAYFTSNLSFLIHVTSNWMQMCVDNKAWTRKRPKLRNLDVTTIKVYVTNKFSICDNIFLRYVIANYVELLIIRNDLFLWIKIISWKVDLRNNVWNESAKPDLPFAEDWDIAERLRLTRLIRDRCFIRYLSLGNVQFTLKLCRLPVS